MYTISVLFKLGEIPGMTEEGYVSAAKQLLTLSTCLYHSLEPIKMHIDTLTQNRVDIKGFPFILSIVDFAGSYFILFI